VRRKPLIRLGRFGFLYLYDILCAKDFNPNERTGYAYSKGNPKFLLAEQLRRAILSYYKYRTDKKEEEIVIPGMKKILITVEKEDIVYQCKNCLTVYDEQVGEPENGIDPGTFFKDLPSTYSCCVCDATKDNFVAVKKEAIGL
jgi:rubredoxin